MSRRDLVVFSLVLACAALIFFVSPRRDEEVELKDTQGFPSDSGILVSDEPDPVSSYDVGYWEGYRAFMEQQGMEVPSEKVVYVVDHGGEVEEGDEDLRGRGYMDGYHKASEGVGCRVCPR